MEPLDGETDRAMMIDLIRWQGMLPSRHTPGSPRWSRRGISAADLADVAEGMTSRYGLPCISCHIDFRQPQESPGRFLERTHQRWCKSLSAGFPPVLSIRRIAWTPSFPPRTIDAHFVTLIAIGAPDPESGAFSMTCIDPWGARIEQATIRFPDHPIFPDLSGLGSCLEITLPQADIGKSSVKPTETSLLLPGASIGCW